MIRKLRKVSFRLSVKEFDDYTFLGRRVYCFELSTLVRKALKELLERNPPKNELDEGPRPTTPARSDVGRPDPASDKKVATRLSDKSLGRKKRRTK